LGRINAKDLELSGMSAAIQVRVIDDRTLIDRFKAGDREAFAAIYREHQAAVFRFAFHMTADTIAAGEVTQDVFVWLIHHPAAFDPGRGALASFLVGVVRKFVQRRTRNARRWLPFDDAVPVAAVGPDLAGGIDAASLRKAIGRLPVRYREAIVLCDLEGRSYEEAAVVLGCAIGTIRSRLHRGRELLARKFQAKEKVS
jgi:RNA polymerase sigma-70 factor (ECF subfamily)